jgi:hypothetical protein
MHRPQVGAGLPGQLGMRSSRSEERRGFGGGLNGLVSLVRVDLYNVRLGRSSLLA